MLIILLSTLTMKSTCYSERKHDFSFTILDVVSMPMSIVYLIAQLDSGTLCLWKESHPLKIRGEAGFLFLKFGERGGSSKKILRNRLVKREVGVPLERERVPNCFISFPSEKHVFVTIGILFLSGKYSLFL